MYAPTMIERTIDTGKVLLDILKETKAEGSGDEWYAKAAIFPVDDQRQAYNKAVANYAKEGNLEKAIECVNKSIRAYTQKESYEEAVSILDQIPRKMSSINKSEWYEKAGNLLERTTTHDTYKSEIFEKAGDEAIEDIFVLTHQELDQIVNRTINLYTKAGVPKEKYLKKIVGKLSEHANEAKNYRTDELKEIYSVKIRQLSLEN